MTYSEEWYQNYFKKRTGQQPEQEGCAIDSMNPPKKQRNQPESDMQIALFDMIYLHESKYPLLRRIFHVPNEGYSGVKGRVKGQKRHREGVRPGIFDIFVDVPIMKAVTRTGTSPSRYLCICPGLRIELKAPGGKISDAQTDWLNYYREAGYRAEICFSWEDAWNIICDYLGYPELTIKT